MSEPAFGPPWPAPAKLNLFLHVTGRRPDGYHELQTLFQLVDLTDEVRIRVRADGRIVRTEGPADVAPDADLVVRAARLLRERAGRPELGADLAVTKRIPLAGGGAKDVYASNIQVADLNALNAVMAVIKWKKLCGFYCDLEREHHSTYTLDGNLLLNEDQA